MKSNKTYNIIIAGVGGQGLITLMQVIAEAVLSQGREVRTSELHGLSQRGGSVIVHLRFGRDVFSPMIAQGKADLILALESQEALRAAAFAGDQTIFLINQYQTPTLAESISEKSIKNNLKKVSKELRFLPASKICQKELGRDVTAGVFLLGYGAAKNLLPLTIESIKKTIKEKMPQKHQEINLKTIDLAMDYAVKK